MLIHQKKTSSMDSRIKQRKLITESGDFRQNIKPNSFFYSEKSFTQPFTQSLLIESCTEERNWNLERRKIKHFILLKGFIKLSCK